MLQSLGVDFIDESEVLTPADYSNHIDKWQFTIPFVCGATNLGEALRRITEGAAMVRSKGEAGTGDVSNAVTHMRRILDEVRRLSSMLDDELYVAAKELQAPYDLVAEVARAGALPVVLFTAGGIATPADAAMMYSSVLAFSSPVSRSSVPRRSSRPPGILIIPMWLPRFRVVLARRWWGSMLPTYRCIIVSKTGAGDSSPEDRRSFPSG